MDVVERLQRECAEDPAVIGFAGGLPDPALFPRQALAASASRVLLAEGEAALQYAWPEGRAGLRRWIATHLRGLGAVVDPDDVIITSGAQQAIAVACDVLVARGCQVAVDAASYPGALDLLRAREARLVPTLTGGVAAAYAMPAMTNPCGEVVAESTLDELVAAARAHGAVLIEDDAYGLLGFDRGRGARLLAKDRDHVVHVGTFSKVLCPGLRVGWLVPPPGRREAVLEAKRVSDLHSNGLAQAIVEDLLGRIDLERYLAGARRHYADKAERLTGALARHLPSWSFAAPRGGFSVWVETPEPGDDAAFLEVAASHGVTFDPGAGYLPGGRPPTMCLRLSFSLVDRGRIDEGVRRLARAWARFRHGTAAA